MKIPFRRGNLFVSKNTQETKMQTYKTSKTNERKTEEALSLAKRQQTLPTKQTQGPTAKKSLQLTENTYPKAA